MLKQAIQDISGSKRELIEMLKENPISGAGKESTDWLWKETRKLAKRGKKGVDLVSALRRDRDRDNTKAF